jgi:hypothetical protein
MKTKLLILITFLSSNMALAYDDEPSPNAEDHISAGYSSMKFQPGNCYKVEDLQYGCEVRINMEKHARTRALANCKRAGYESCEEISSLCIDDLKVGSRNATAWEVLMKGYSRENVRHPIQLPELDQI